jgi:GNAT superfamily N-acetyltransferase
VIPENTPKGTITGGMEQDVGMIAAIVNPRHNEIHDDDIGFFGLFECVNSQQVADALLDAAAAWLRGQGRSAMRGPLSFTMTDEVGVLIDGFGDMPRIMMPYNHPYYPELLEAYGLQKAMDLYAYHLDMMKLYGGTPEGLPPKLTRVVEKLRQQGRMTIHKVDMKNFDAEVKKVMALYNAAWEKNWGAVGITDHELAHYAAEMKPVLDPDLAFFVEVDGKSAGVALCLPDANLVLKKMNGRVFPFGFIQALRYQKQIKWGRVWALGVLPEYLNLGVGPVMIYEIAVQGMRKGIMDFEASWVLENNVNARKSVEGVGGEIYKTYRVYEMAL